VRVWILSIALISCGCSACDRADADLPGRYRRIEVPVALLKSGDAVARGRALYRERCMLCHGAALDGHGVRHEGFARPARNFTDPEWRRSTTPRHIFFAIREGVQGTDMPAWKDLDDQQTWDLVAYILAGHP
jgi:mono/diheme cytochrome c family protein